MRVVFGDCEFDAGRHLLLRHGCPATLSPKAFQLLQFLLDRRPDAVSKGELMEQLWPDTFVSDASLHNVVAEVRAAIGDAPRAALYIRTVARYGYAFHGDVRPAAPGRAGSPRLPGAHLFSTREEWRLSEGANLIGRDRDCAVRIDSTTVSRHHARIVVTGGEATIEDLASKNGTYVNGERVSRPIAIHDGAEIRVGAEAMTYRTIEALPSTATQHV